MFNNNDYVVHPRAGVCRITDTIEMPLQTHGSKKQAVYYILQPIENVSEKIYLPAENAEIAENQADQRQQPEHGAGGAL